MTTDMILREIVEQGKRYLYQYNVVYSHNNIENDRLGSYIEYNHIEYWNHIQKASSILFARKYFYIVSYVSYS